MAGVLVVTAVLGACGGGGHVDYGVVRHVFLIVMENHSAPEALTGTFTASLAARYEVLSNYHAITHPSVPNYLALTSGSTWGLADDSYHVLPNEDLGTQLTRAGVTWRAYMEGLGDQGCLKSPVPYDLGHNPFAFYGGGCPPNVVPFTSFAGDLAGSTPRFSWITPDRCHDTHDCSVATGDDWLKQTVGEITNSTAWKESGVLFITWDEDDATANNRVLTLVVTPRTRHGVNNQAYDHYSTLATIEGLMGVAPLGEAAHAHTIDVLGP